jgi:hypothetical protein
LSLIPRPTNDDFARRITVEGNAPAFSGHNIGATLEPGETLLDASSQGRSVWWTWTAPASGTVHIGDTWPFYLGVFVGSSISNLLPVASGYGAMDFYAHAGTTYQISVADSYGSEGTFDLAFTGLPQIPGLPPEFAVLLSDGRFQIRVVGELGQSFAIQASTNLLDWETLAIDTMVTGIVDFMDADAASYPQRFYRVVPLDTLFSPSGLRIALPPGPVTGGFSVRILGPAGQPFSLRATSDLVQWEEISRGWITGDWVDFLDADASSHPVRFYQVVPLP